MSGGCVLGNKIRCGIIGAASYTGGELLRILSIHPFAEISCVTSETFEGKSVACAHPFLLNCVDIGFVPYDASKIRENCDVVFLAKPQPSSFGYVKDLFGGRLKIIDLSAGFRFKDASVFESWYGMKHGSPEFLADAVYGMPELYFEEISKAVLVANPGCYPTCAVLATAPLLKNGMADAEGICINAVSGFSGAGKAKANESNFAPEIFNNIKPYNITGHPHTPEIEEELSRICGRGMKVTFVPHVAGFERGILTTIYLKPSAEASLEELNGLYAGFYQNRRFVRIRTGPGRAEIKDVVYSNFCDVGIQLNRRTGVIIITSAIDNLIKGASGQAVQNMNIMFGLPECSGLLPGGESE